MGALSAAAAAAAASPHHHPMEKEMGIGMGGPLPVVASLEEVEQELEEMIPPPASASFFTKKRPAWELPFGAKPKYDTSSRNSPRENVHPPSILWKSTKTS